MTKREKFEFIGKVFAGDVTVDMDEAMKAEIVEFCETELAAIDKKNEKARERAAAKKEEGDALTERVFEVIAAATEPKTVNDILAALDDETLTPSKIVARLTRLVKAERVNRETIKVEGRKLKAYIAC